MTQMDSNSRYQYSTGRRRLIGICCLLRSCSNNQNHLAKFSIVSSLHSISTFLNFLRRFLTDHLLCHQLGDILAPRRGLPLLCRPAYLPSNADSLTDALSYANLTTPYQSLDILLIHWYYHFSTHSCPLIMFRTLKLQVFPTYLL